MDQFDRTRKLARRQCMMEALVPAIIGDILDDSSQPPKTVARLLFDRKREPTTRFGVFGSGFSRMTRGERSRLNRGGKQQTAGVPLDHAVVALDPFQLGRQSTRVRRPVHNLAIQMPSRMSKYRQHDCEADEKG